MYDSSSSSGDVERELDVADAFSNTDSDYWVRDGWRLVPATPDQIAAICEYEGERHLAYLKEQAWRAQPAWRHVWRWLTTRGTRGWPGHTRIATEQAERAWISRLACGAARVPPASGRRVQG